jgi:hypothetical protein
MIGGFLLPGKTMANMFFVLFSYSELPFPTARSRSRPDLPDLRRIDPVKQAELLLMDLKFAQCMCLNSGIPDLSPLDLDTHQT